MEEHKLLEDWREDNLIIGYMEGDFDNIKLDCIQLLKYATQHCDKLVIGLTSDYIIKLKHSVNCPQNNFNQRKQMLEAMEYADLILPIEEMDSSEMIEHIKPNKIFINSDDPKYNNIKQLINSWHGEIVVTDSVYMKDTHHNVLEKAIITGLNHVLINVDTKTPNYDNLYLINILSKEGYKILVITCQQESTRKEWETWLKKYINVDKMYMRASAVTNTAKIKEEIYHKYIMDKYDVEFVFDHDEDNCEMWSEHQLNCMHVL